MNHLRQAALLFCAALSLFSFAGQAFGQDLEEFKIAAAGTEESNSLGWSAAIDGEWAVLGDYNGGTATSLVTGLCTVYRRTAGGWISWQTLTPGLNEVLQQFGYSVAILGEEIIVGSRRGGQDNAGRVHVFNLIGDQWVEVQQLKAIDGAPGHTYGHHLAFDDQTLVVGAMSYPDDSSVPWGLGTCYVYERAAGSWSFSERIPLPDYNTTPHEYWSLFGWSCSVDGDVMVIGAPTTSGQGMAFVYRRGATGWQREADLYLPQFAPITDLLFGTTVGVSGGTIAVGAPVRIGPFYWGPSSVWIFEYDPLLGIWIQTEGFRASDVGLAEGGADRFGLHLSLSDDRLLVGAEYGGFNGPQSGTAYLFERRGGVWGEADRLVPSDPNPYPGTVTAPSRFARAVALDAKNNRAVIGAPLAYVPGYASSEFPGAAYFFDLNQGDVVCDGGLNSATDGTRLTVTGSRQVGEANLSLSIYDGPPGFVGLFMVGPGGTPLPFGVNGSLCVGQPFARMTGIRTIGPEGSAMHQVDFTQHPASTLISPGARLTFQFAHRDMDNSTGQPTVNTSQAVEVVFE